MDVLDVNGPSWAFSRPQTLNSKPPAAQPSLAPPAAQPSSAATTSSSAAARYRRPEPPSMPLGAAPPPPSSLFPPPTVQSPKSKVKEPCLDICTNARRHRELGSNSRLQCAASRQPPVPTPHCAALRKPPVPSAEQQSKTPVPSHVTVLLWQLCSASLLLSKTNS
jgi:hypothetical protein